MCATALFAFVGGLFLLAENGLGYE